jgi:hypothetical protein
MPVNEDWFSFLCALGRRERVHHQIVTSMTASSMWRHFHIITPVDDADKTSFVSGIARRKLHQHRDLPKRQMR